MVTRREFLVRSLSLPLACSGQPLMLDLPRPTGGLDRAAARLRAQFPDLRRHFIFEYYPWYAANPWRHWEMWDRVPPTDLAATSAPLLGAYDSRAAGVIEQHARWIAESDVGAVNISWWGPDSFEDRAVPLVMDVMRAHDIRVAFHLEPYRDDRHRSYARDVLYLLKQYGERRRWDCLLMLDRADGSSGPVFKSFWTLRLPRSTDCHGVMRPDPGYEPDAVWREQTDSLRRELARDFDHLTLLSDSLDVHRTREAGFDGLAIFDNYISPDAWPRWAALTTAEDRLFSFNVNPGFDAIQPRTIEPGSCYRPLPFEPASGPLEWTSAESRARAQTLATERIRESLETTLTLQAERGFANARHGFFLVYINSFNEWHEGTQFEPAKPRSALTAEERRLGYHNPDDGAYRLEALQGLLGRICSGS